MEQILNKVHNVDPNNSEEVKDVIFTFIQCLPKYKEAHSNRLLRELEIVINRFPKYCMKHRNNIEIFLISFLSSNNYYNVIEAAKCAHVLQQVRPTQEKSATSKISWKDQMNLLCYAAHTLIGSVFSDAVDMYRSNIKPNKSANSPMCLELVGITKRKEDKSDRYLLGCLKLKNVLVFIQAMLVEIYPVAKPIQPQIILDLIVRVLSVTSSVKQSDSDVASIKIEALRTLDALIVCLGSNLIPYSALLFRLVLQTLRWSSNNTNDTSKIRCVAYKTLSNWLTTLHVYRMSDSRTSWEDELVTNIVADITPARKLVQITLGQQPSRHLSKKAKRKLAATQLQESNIAAYGPGENNKIAVSEEVSDDIALAALECAETFLIVCGRFLKPATHKLFQERLVRECYNYPTYTDERLLSLIRVLEATRKTTPNNVPPTTQYCLHLYSLLVNSKRAEISKFCSEALLDIRMHLHCSPPSLNFALEIPHETENTKSRKKVSKRNRAVLEALLGADKLPTDDNEDEVISIPDESSSKKLRLSEDIDKISVSSDSISSVDVSDDSDDDNVHEIEVVVDINESNRDDDDTPLVIAEDEETTEEDSEVQNIEQTQAMIDASDVQRQIVCMENMITDDTEVTKEPITKSIYEAQTQLQLNASNDTVEEERPLSLEIGYDYPNTGPEKVTVLEKIDDENLPSSADTDDVQITCGQVVNNTPEIDLDKKSGEESKAEEIPKINGICENTVENGFSGEKPIENIINEAIKVSTKKDETSVEDMLADFVDEVNEEAAEA